MQYYLPTPSVRADEASCCCSGCSCCGKPACSKRNWGSVCVGIAFFLQLASGILGIGQSGELLFALKDVYVGARTSYFANYSQYESFRLDGSLYNIYSCYSSVDGTAPWRATSDVACSWVENGTAVVTGSYLPAAAMGVRWHAAEERIRPACNIGIAFGLFAAVLFMVSGPHWPQCFGGPGSACEAAVASHAQIAAMKRQSKALVAGLVCSTISWAAYFTCVSPYGDYIRAPLRQYYAARALPASSRPGGEGAWSGITGEYGPYDLPTDDPAYGYLLGEGSGYFCILTAAIAGSTALFFMLLFAAFCRGALCCEWPGSLGPDKPDAEVFLAVDGGMARYSTASTELPFGYPVPVAYALPVPLAIPVRTRTHTGPMTPHGTMEGFPPGIPVAYGPAALPVGPPLWYHPGGEGRGVGTSVASAVPLLPALPTHEPPAYEHGRQERQDVDVALQGGDGPEKDGAAVTGGSTVMHAMLTAALPTHAPLPTHSPADMMGTAAGGAAVAEDEQRAQQPADKDAQ